MPIRVRVQGQRQTEQKLRQVARDLGGERVLSVLRRATLLIVRDARRNSPVDTGRLKNSIISSVEADGVTSRNPGFTAVVGSNVAHALYMEMGTGTPAGHRPHRPPGGALDLWAQRHGMSSGFIVARSIARRGGLEPREFLQNAVRQHRQSIITLLETEIERIVGE